MLSFHVDEIDIDISADCDRSLDLLNLDQRLGLVTPGGDPRSEEISCKDAS